MYAMTGGQPIPGAGIVNFRDMALAAGYPVAYDFDDLETFENTIEEVFQQDGPTLICCHTVPDIRTVLEQRAASRSDPNRRSTLPKPSRTSARRWAPPSPHEDRLFPHFCVGSFSDWIVVNCRGLTHAQAGLQFVETRDGRSGFPMVRDQVEHFLTALNEELEVVPLCASGSYLRFRIRASLRRCLPHTRTWRGPTNIWFVRLSIGVLLIELTRPRYGRLVHSLLWEGAGCRWTSRRYRQRRVCYATGTALNLDGHRAASRDSVRRESSRPIKGRSGQ